MGMFFFSFSRIIFILLTNVLGTNCNYWEQRMESTGGNDKWKTQEEPQWYGGENHNETREMTMTTLGP